MTVETEIARGELIRIPVRELQLKRKLRLIYVRTPTSRTPPRLS